MGGPDFREVFNSTVGDCSRLVLQRDPFPQWGETYIQGICTSLFSRLDCKHVGQGVVLKEPPSGLNWYSAIFDYLYYNTVFGTGQHIVLKRDIMYYYTIFYITINLSVFVRPI